MAADSALIFHPGMDQPVRRGTLQDHCRSTHDLFAERARAGDFEAAAELAGHTLTEAQEPVELYAAWLPMIRAFLHRHGVAEPRVAAAEERWLADIHGPDGRFDPDAGWAATRAEVARARALCAAGDAEGAIAALEASRRLWHDTHDRQCDHVQALIAIVAEQLGEAAIGPLWQELMAPMFDSYEAYDTDRRPWPESAQTLLLITAEALRGHLTGPGRRGTLELVEEEGRIGFRFAPCGSGGRNFTGETHGSFPLTTAKHDWAWNMEGVCLYCAHCCALSEVNPIRRFGYPAREVEPPYRTAEGRRDHCTWWVWHDPALVPEAVYRRTGNVKPARLGGAATRARRSAHGTGQPEGKRDDG